MGVSYMFSIPYRDLISFLYTKHHEISVVIMSWDFSKFLARARNYTNQGPEIILIEGQIKREGGEISRVGAFSQ